MQGVAASVTFIVMMPELIDIVKCIYPSDLSQDQISDIAAALQNASMHVGEIIGPIGGGIAT
jgi:hypothetical protein